MDHFIFEGGGGGVGNYQKKKKKKKIMHSGPREKKIERAFLLVGPCLTNWKTAL